MLMLSFIACVYRLYNLYKQTVFIKTADCCQMKANQLQGPAETASVLGVVISSSFPVTYDITALIG